MKKEFKAFKFETKTFREDDEYFFFEGYLSTFDNVDRGDDVVDRGAFTESLKEHNPSLFWSHDADEPLGVFEDAYEDHNGLYVKGKMPKADTLVSGRIIPQMKVGSIRSMSIGYSVKNREDSNYDEKGIRHLKKVFLWEGSLVTIPMNAKAEVLKSMNQEKEPEKKTDLPIASRNTDWEKESAVERIKEWAGIHNEDSIPDPESQKKYEKAFVWIDREDDDLVSSYKMPIADIVDGELTIIPRAIFSLAGALKGARYGVDIPTEDIPKAIEVVKKHYEKMGMQSPFDDSKAFKIDDFSALEERVFEKLLCQGARFSRKNAKTLISFIKSSIKASESVDGETTNQSDSDNDLEWGEVFESIKGINLNMENKNA